MVEGNDGDDDGGDDGENGGREKIGFASGRYAVNEKAESASKGALSTR
jgi:hypothetical protein